MTESIAETGKKNKPAERALDLEIKDAQLIFNSVWSELLEELGEETLSFPREIFWLNGAPGAGKGTQTRFIMEYCGLTARPIVISDLLNSPEARRLKDAGMMVGDREVTSLLFKELLKPSKSTGVVVDGFPRTKVQVECLKLFFQKLTSLRAKYLGTEYEARFHKPIFHIIVLYVDEPVSVNRQLHRGRLAQEHNRQVESTGTGRLKELRKTDLDVNAARNRYRTFKEITYESLTSLREIFHYHLVNAQQSIEEVQQNIVEELKYQSSLELNQRTNDIISRVPISTDILVHARQDLVQRLEQYTMKHLDLFEKVVAIIEEKFIPIVLRHAVAGRAYINSEDETFENSLALVIAIDVFSERGYHAAVDVRQEEIPHRFDLKTGLIETRRKKVFRFSIHFQGSVIRRGQ
ncbi:MAG TPA: nucleoside monophosphate kinase [Oceanipulchritudo sp.]|nr:nucleoside monophosphate kinase [Oceanipulchritudo sp.]